MTNKKIKTKKETGVGFNFLKLGFGDLFKGIEKLAELAEKAEKAGGHLKREGMIRGMGGSKDFMGVYGFNIRTGIGKKTRIEPFGNIKTTPKGPRITKTREPLVDVLDEKDHILVIVELPGMEERDINLDLKGDILTLEARHGKRIYRKEILLPSLVEKEKQISFKNGVLEVRFGKKTI